MKLRNKLIATIVSISMVLAVIGVGAWASTESFTATITNTVNLEFDNIKGQIGVMAGAGADNIDDTDEPWLDYVVLYDGSNTIYNQISSNVTSGTNLYWEGTKFLDSSEDGLGVLDNETSAAALMYTFLYEPTEDCVGTSTITAMVTEINCPEIDGGKLIVRYFASTDEATLTELESGVAFTAIQDSEYLIIFAICQYYNQSGESITTTASAWDFEVIFTAGQEEVTPLTGSIVPDFDLAGGVLLPYDYESPGESLWEIIEFGEYPQTLKASDVTITSETPDADGYYPGSDGARYAMVEADTDIHPEFWGEAVTNSMLRANNGFQMIQGEVYYFKVEPIKWRVLNEADGKALIVSDSVLQSATYHNMVMNSPGDEYPEIYGGYARGNGAPVGTYSNNYYYSDIRVYFNGSFYSKTFNATEKNSIVLTTVDNSAATTASATNPYVCEDTQDYIFALSYKDITNPLYGFNSDSAVYDEARSWKATDFAKATGVLTVTNEILQFLNDSGLEAGSLTQNLGSSFAWTRTPTAELPQQAYAIAPVVSMGDVHALDSVSTGIAPAMYITR